MDKFQTIEVAANIVTILGFAVTILWPTIRNEFIEGNILKRYLWVQIFCMCLMLIGLILNLQHDPGKDILGIFLL